MTPLEMIAEWRKGCSNVEPGDGPESCQVCTRELVEAIERSLRVQPTPATLTVSGAAAENLSGVHFEVEHPDGSRTQFGLRPPLKR